jgi:prepilin-type N-terminal cleavage/methylation domain-containing protein
MEKVFTNTRQRGFTLAEVLITLGIIGVVAALTIPALISKTQTLILKNQFKKFWAATEITFQKIAFENEGIECYYFNGSYIDRKMDECSIFWDEFSKSMNVVKKCGSNAFAGGCIPEYDYAASAGCRLLSLNSVNTGAAYVFNDGSILMTTNSPAAYFLFDVNGMKGPNKVGHDLFATKIDFDGKKFYIDSSVINFCLPQDEALFTSYEDIFN